jgi:hypothetical protein
MITEIIFEFAPISPFLPHKVINLLQALEINDNAITSLRIS